MNQLSNAQDHPEIENSKSPCEMVIWVVLPSIRAAIAEELVKRGLAQREISDILGITPSAVSQYVSKKRGYNIEFEEDIKATISQLADDLVEKKVSDPAERICDICRMLRKDKFHSSCRYRR